MNVASLELCRELYELSGWGDTKEHWLQENRRWRIRMRPANVSRISQRCPAYDLGYLLRKLPRNIDLSDVEERLGLTFMVVDASKWLIRYDNSNETFRYLSNIADAPEDAAAKLAIELFKHGILPRGGDAD